MTLYEEALFYTGAGEGRWQLIAKAIDDTHHVGGEIWECGAWQGGTALWMRNYIGEDSSRTIRAFDSFNGLPSSGPNDCHPIGAMKADYVTVSTRLGYRGIHVYAGIMPDSFSGLEQSIISVAHIDVDQYDSVNGCLKWLYPRVHNGGYLIIDDYGDGNCPGAKLATDEFVATNGLTLIRHTDICCPQAYFIKP